MGTWKHNCSTIAHTILQVQCMYYYTCSALYKRGQGQNTMTYLARIAQSCRDMHVYRECSGITGSIEKCMYIPILYSVVRCSNGCSQGGSAI